MSSEKDIDFVLRTVEKRDIRFVRLWFTDVLGNLKSFAISPEELEESFEEGIGFDGSSIDGFVSLEESDMLAFPDPDTFCMLPWRPSESAVARVFCDVYTPDRKPFEGDPRACLLKVFTEADKKGYIPNVGPKIEYFYSDSQTGLQPKDDAGYFDLTPLDNANDLRRQTTLMLEKMSIPVQYSYHAAGPSQNGVELRYTEAVSCADNIMTARLVIKQLAAQQGMYASFMPKPVAGQPGSAMFLYQSLFDHNGENLFWAPKDYHPAHLSDLGQHYVAGDSQVRPRVHAGHEPHGELLQALHLHRRGPQLRHVGPQEPLRARPHPRAQARQALRHPPRAAQPRSDRQPLPRPCRDHRCGP